MPVSSLSWSDTFASLVVPDTISYKLPPGIDISKAPSKIVIDGFGSLEMQRTRVSVHNKQAIKIIDETKRSPLQAGLYQGPTASKGHLCITEAGVPVIGFGRGQESKDKGLYSTGQMVAFGISMFSVVVGLLAISVSPIWGIGALVAGVLTMGDVLRHAYYHVVDGSLSEDAKETVEV